MSFGRAYTTSEHAEIARGQRAGASMRETASAVGHPYSSVKSYASDAGLLQKPYWPDADTALLLAYGRAGFTAAEIADRLRRTVRAVRGRLRRLGTSLEVLREEGARSQQSGAVADHSR